tara:strand:- start:80 stop:1210 length:1131 start_codon:yes stop_codon:yes gene_type:complete
MKRKLSILHVIMGYPPRLGGAENQAKLIAEHQAKKGHKVSVFTRFETGLKRKELKNNVLVYRSFFTNFKASKEITSIIIGVKLFFKHNEFDVVQVHQGHVLASVISLVCFFIKKPCFIKIANSGEKFDLKILEKRAFIGKYALKIMLKTNPYFVSITNQITEELKTLNVSKNHIFEIPNGVLLNENITSTRKRFDSKNICFLGRLEPIKRPEMIIKFSEQFEEDVSFHIYGEGSLKNQLTMLNKNKKIKNLFIHGSVDNVSNILSNATLLVLPSLTEGMSNSLLEALSHALPVIATNIPQNRFIIENDLNIKAGSLIDSESHEAWTSKIKFLLRNYDEYNLLSSNSLKLSKIFDIKRTSCMYTNTYLKIINSELFC